MVEISIDEKEALVLFELLSRFQQADAITIEHSAEERVLWNLCALLERELTVIFDQDYLSKLREARESITGQTPEH